jgi:NTP pyrophosphatase (non-canonical NTP hydrolase)
MKFEDYQSHVSRTMNHEASNKEALSNYSMGLAGESGEVLEALKKHLYHGHELDYSDMEKELGDVLWYLTAIANELCIDLDEVANRNVRKLQARYPDGFDAELSQKRETDKE